ncbi:MAG: hypothetical protein IIY03_01720 [Muribaculaceae bacterium]|nr:hypothetical protein [Muribaculaceae bacterium]
MSSGLLVRVIHFFVEQWCRSALTLRVRGVVFHAIKQYLVFGLQPSRSFAYTHSTLKPTVFKVTFCSGFRLFVFVYALHSVVKPTLASVFITTLRFIQTIASLKGFDRTIRSITLLVSTPRGLHERQASTLLS